MPRTACRVVCGRSLMMATFVPTSAFVSVDFPAFGRPTKHANPARYPSVTAPLSRTNHSRNRSRYGDDGRVEIVEFGIDSPVELLDAWHRLDVAVALETLTGLEPPPAAETRRDLLSDLGYRRYGLAALDEGELVGGI